MVKVLDSLVRIVCTYPDQTVRDETLTAFIIRRRYPLKHPDSKLRPVSIVFYYVDPEVIVYFGEYFQYVLHPSYSGTVSFIKTSKV